MKNSAQQGEKDSVRGATIFERVVCRGCRAALCLVPGHGFAWGAACRRS
jgi:hypothetical protein